MSELAVFQAELDRLERENRWDAPEYDFLATKVEELKAAEPKPPASPAAPTGQQQPDLASRMLAMQANPERYSDAQRVEILAEYNHAVIATDPPQAERVDVQALQRDMLVASADPSGLTDEQRADLSRRYDRAVVQGPERRTSTELKADLGSADLGARMRAAAELQQRGELSEEQVTEVVAGYNQAVHETTSALEATAGIEVGGLPEELRPAAEAIAAAAKSLEVPPDPVDAALYGLNQAIRGMQPPSLEQQLEALGVEPAPELGAEPEQVPEPASQGG